MNEIEAKHEDTRTLMQKEIGIIIRDTKRPAWMKCEAIERIIKEQVEMARKEFLNKTENYRKYLARIQLKDPNFTIEGLYKLFNMEIKELKQSLDTHSQGASPPIGRLNPDTTPSTKLVGSSKGCNPDARNGVKLQDDKDKTRETRKGEEENK